MRELVREFGLCESIPQTFHKLQKFFSTALNQQQEIVVLCVGSSKVLGDCFGATVGDFLLSKNLPFWIYGNSTSNVNATNINVTQKLISLIHKNCTILVVDALSTTNPSLIGDIILSDEYVALNKHVSINAQMFLFATTTYLGHQNLHAKISIVNSLAKLVSNTIEQAFISAKHVLGLEFLHECVN